MSLVPAVRFSRQYLEERFISHNLQLLITMSISYQKETPFVDATALEAGVHDSGGDAEDHAGETNGYGSRGLSRDKDGVGGSNGNGVISSSTNGNSIQKSTCSWQYVFDETW